MSYYKYAERDASTQVNWAEIGKNLTDTFQEEARVREEKKAAIDANTREYSNTLNTAPQGEFQDGNAFINNYVAAQQQTRLMDDKLLKSGQMDLKTYTMRRQNGVDGTTQLFNLQKKFQSVYSERMKGILDGSLQAQTAFELSQVQGFGDFSKSQALINPVDGRVNVGMTEIVNGVRKVIPNSNVPVNVLMGKIQSGLPTYDVNTATKSLVDSQGDLVLSLYKAGSLSGAGTITELTGLAAIEKFAGKSWTDAAKKMNESISNGVNSILTNKRNLTSVLTGQVGGYSAESFTYDKNVAAKDPTKILLKPSVDGGPGIMDENAPNYQKQYKQAADWITTSIKSQMDAKVGVKETSQLSRNDAPEYVGDRNDKKIEAQNFGINLAKALKSTNIQERDNAIKYLAQKAQRQVIIKGGKLIVKNIDGKGESSYELNSDPDKLSSSLVSAFGVDLPENEILKFAKSTLRGNRTNAAGEVSGLNVTEIKPMPILSIPSAAITESSQRASVTLKDALPTGFKVTDKGGIFGQQIEVKAPNGKIYNYSSKKTLDGADIIKKDLEAFVKANSQETEL